MKSADFFIAKAIVCINSIDEILPNVVSSPFSDETKYAEQSKTLSDLSLKIKLLFSEFDNGELFKDKIISIDENKMLWGKRNEVLKQYYDVLSLFIKHINEFRK